VKNLSTTGVRLERSDHPSVRDLVVNEPAAELRHRLGAVCRWPVTVKLLDRRRALLPLVRLLAQPHLHDARVRRRARPRATGSGRCDRSDSVPRSQPPALAHRRRRSSSTSRRRATHARGSFQARRCRRRAAPGAHRWCRDRGSAAARPRQASGRRWKPRLPGGREAPLR
jgi:hypothetical protein